MHLTQHPSTYVLDVLDEMITEDGTIDCPASGCFRRCIPYIFRSRGFARVRFKHDHLDDLA